MKKEISIDCGLFEHGGNIYRLAEELKIQERKIVDFSSSVNPLGISKKIKAEIRKHLKYLHNHPDPETKRLRTRLAKYFSIEPEMILCGNGSTELIYLITRSLKPKKVLIPVPTYSEYERALLLSWQSENKENSIGYLVLNEENDFEINPDKFIKEIQILKDHSHSLDMIFLCNPNNPTGRLLRRQDVKKIADKAAEMKCYLIVDEAFIDFCPNETIIKEVENNPYLVVLRTMTNFHAISGLRIGYGILPAHLINIMKEVKEPWTVNSLAQRAAVIALKDRVFKKETAKLIAEEKMFLEKNFKKLNIKFFPSDTNFYLLKIDNAQEICNYLMKKGILVRGCSNFKGLDSTYLRVSVNVHRENTILVKELTSFLKS